MFVNNSKPVSSAAQNANVEMHKANENATHIEKQQSKKDKIEFSYQSEKVKEELISKMTKKIVDETTNEDQINKIETLKMQIKNNTYSIDADLIAQKMISDEE